MHFETIWQRSCCYPEELLAVKTMLMCGKNFECWNWDSDKKTVFDKIWHRCCCYPWTTHKFCSGKKTCWRGRLTHHVCSYWSFSEVFLRFSFGVVNCVCGRSKGKWELCFWSRIVEIGSRHLFCSQIFKALNFGASQVCSKMKVSFIAGTKWVPKLLVTR